MRPRQVKIYCLLMRKAEVLLTPRNPDFVYIYSQVFIYALELTNIDLIQQT